MAKKNGKSIAAMAMAAPMPEKRPVRALIMDADQTIRRNKNEPTGFINEPDDVELMPGIEALMWKYRRLGYLVAVVSNQGGVAAGHIRPQDAEAIMDRTVQLFEKNPIQIFKMCYSMPPPLGTVKPYNLRSLCRKPDIGMLVLVEVEAWHSGYVIDWDNSLFVGDREEDETCANRAGMRYKHIDAFLAEPTPPLPSEN